ncbi:type II secretion system F family protein [Haloechinothrix sp. YIM 98757]|uniref:Type II secretion system F family protein n=1 Tax=Haloechinothrix aidingensis TaxID=2752311 RepID=A0A838ADA8_9PSEU|nr:type II secretion system F family protein [Haloechinothrix aidingensis]MBA0127272.1 type II secretion system F family protein [Haloechinothrix aidingensis]
MTAIVPTLPGLAVALAILSGYAAYRHGESLRALHLFRRLPGLVRRARNHGRRPGRLAAALLAGTAAWLGTTWPVAGLAVAAATVAGPRVWAAPDAESVITRLEALAAWCRRLADVLASGAGGLEQAIATTATRTPPAALEQPIRDMASRLRSDGLEPALRHFAEELADPNADAVVAALLLRVRAGGRGLVDVLHAQAEALAAEAATRREVEAERAKPRTDARLVLTITAAMVAGLVIVSGDFLAPYSSAGGQLMLALIAAVMGTACWWMYRLSRPQRPGRLLLGSRHTPVSGTGVR